MKKAPQAKSFLVGIIILLVFVLAAVWSIVGLVRYERGRDLANWQITLGVMADSRANAVNEWADEQYRVLQELADNGSLQLYTQQLVQRPEENKSSEPAEISYLRSLIRATAERHGFVDKQAAGRPINANVAFQADNSLTLFDSELRIITGTPGIVEPDGPLREAVGVVLRSGNRSFVDLRLNANGRPVLGFVVPVYALQKQSNEPQVVAALYGAKDAALALFPLVGGRNEVTRTDEAFLVEARGDLVVYLSPLADGSLPLKKSFSANADELVAVQAVNRPGLFMQLRDYAGKETLFTSRKLAGLPWTLVQKIEVHEALEESRVHQSFLFSALFLSLLLVSALMIAAWWYGSTLRERRAATELRLKSRELEARTNLLNAINDHLADSIFLLDGGGRFIFANRTMAMQLGMAAGDIVGKNLVGVLGPQGGKILEGPCREALHCNRVLLREVSLAFTESGRAFSAVFVPVNYGDEQGPADTVLVSLHDVTLLHEAQQKKERLMEQIVSALMRAIDMHDPYTANHSANTAAISLAIGRVMQVDQASLATLEVAANLCNLGKLSIPREVLTKSGALSDDEQALVKQETAYAREILSRIDFEGPVLEIVAQKHEYIDGTGYPEGIKGEEIVLLARILAVANAFVAMISPRAYREKMSGQQAMQQLLSGADSKYDRHVVAALFHVAENIIDWTVWDERKQISSLSE